MLEQVDLCSPCRSAPSNLCIAQETRLFELQWELFDQKVPVMIAFEGWDAAGKGTIIDEAESLGIRVQTQA